MGMYTVECPVCKKPTLWWSGTLDQRCSECKLEKPAKKREST